MIYPYRTSRRQTAVANLQTPSLTQAITFSVLDAWGYDGFKAHTETVSRFYRGKRDVFERAMHRHLNGLAEWSTPEAGMFFWCAFYSPSPSLLRRLGVISEISGHTGSSSCLPLMARKAATPRASSGPRRTSVACSRCRGQYSCLAVGRQRTYARASVCWGKRRSRRL